MEITEFRILAVLLTLLCPSINSLEQLNCKKGYLDITLEGSAKPILRMNCKHKPAVVTVREKNLEECQDGKLKIISRGEWGAAMEKLSVETLPTTDCVTVDGSNGIVTDMDYIGKMKRDDEHNVKLFGAPFQNFYIGDNGVLYEALGWDKFFYLQSGGFKCLRIAFMKPTKEGAPSMAAINAFNELLKTAICLEKLSPSYRIIPLYFINVPGNLIPNSFERKDILKWDRCVQDSDLTKEKYNYGSFPIIFREDWGAKDPVNPPLNRTSKIKYVIVGHSWDRCFTTENCIQLLKWLQNFLFTRNANFNANFFIGDDGFAYEAYPWNQTWDSNHINKDAILIHFFGNFELYLPSDRAMTTFRRILKLGELWGYLSPDYKIVSFKQTETNAQNTRHALDIAVREMARFSPEFK